MRHPWLWDDCFAYADDGEMGRQRSSHQVFVFGPRNRQYFIIER